MFLHSAAAIILVVPVVMPLVRSVGIDPVHFGLIVTINLGIGQQTPPVASVLMVASSIAKESVWAVTRVNVWFILVLVDRAAARHVRAGYRTRARQPLLQVALPP